eukprot:363864-Chlamydomonas_euryale.AAC.10
MPKHAWGLYAPRGCQQLQNTFELYGLARHRSMISSACNKLRSVDAKVVKQIFTDSASHEHAPCQSTCT